MYETRLPPQPMSQSDIEQHEEWKRRNPHIRVLIAKNTPPPWKTNFQAVLGKHDGLRPLNKFTLFPKLPAELQDIIWALAIPEGRIVRFYSRKKYTRGDPYKRRRSPYDTRYDFYLVDGDDLSTDTTAAAPEANRAEKAGHENPDQQIHGTTASDDVGSLRVRRRSARIAALNQAVAPSQAVPEKDDNISQIASTTTEGVVTAKPTSGNIPALLQTSRNSREVALKFFTLSFHSQLDGKPIYINFNRDTLRVRRRRDILILCGIKNPHKFLSENNADIEKLVTRFPKRRNEAEENLRALTILDHMDSLTIQALARFRKLEVLVTKKKSIHIALRVIPYESPLEDKLKQLWTMNEEKMGTQCSPTMILKFKYLSHDALYT